MQNGGKEKKGKKIRNENFHEVRFLIHHKVRHDLEKISERDGRSASQLIRAMIPMMIAQFPQSWLKD